jgi:uncharacterized repeat protein (TIGR02543 family)
MDEEREKAVTMDVRSGCLRTLRLVNSFSKIGRRRKAFPRFSVCLVSLLVIFALAFSLPTLLFAATIEVSVPTKVLWAAFGSDSGTVTSPLYHVRNNSNILDLKVTLNSFSAKDTPANKKIDPSLSLEMTSPANQMGLVDDLFYHETGYTNTVATPFTNILAHNDTWDFGIEGNYSASIEKDSYLPRYDMVFSFSIDGVEVHFNTHGGTPEPESIIVKKDKPYGTLPEPERTGYEFEGWWTTEAIGGLKIEDTTLVTNTFTHTLHARWKENFTPLVFKVSIEAGESFAIPTSGYGVDGISNAAYSWDIDWGDGSAPEPASGTSSQNSAVAGISHPYANAGTYTITITPHNPVSFGWARAFAFSDKITSSSAVANKAKVREVLSIPMKGFLQSATQTGRRFMNNVWYGCAELTSVAFNDPFTYPITSVDAEFLFHTWHGCSALTSAAVPNTSNWRPSSVGSYFLSHTWRMCTSLKTAIVPDTSNWNITGSIGDGFLYYAWQGCTALNAAAVPNTSLWSVSDPLGDYFLHSTWSGCTALTVAVVPDTSDWTVAGSLGNYFLSYAWYNCTSLATPAVPDTSGWNVTGSVGTNFLSYAWYKCPFTTAAIPNTSNWNITGSLGTDFLSNTWYSCTSLTTPLVPNTSGWTVTGSVGNNFLISTWRFCTFTTAAVPVTSNWSVTGSLGESFLASTWRDCAALTAGEVPDTSGWNITDSVGANFLSQTWEDCVTLTTAKVPDTSNWNITSSIGDNFLYYTWCRTSLAPALVPNTSGWRPTSVGNFFLGFTWAECKNLAVAEVPETSNWPVVSLGNNFLQYAWQGCNLLATAKVPITSGWRPDFVGHSFLAYTWYGCVSLPVAVVPDTSDWRPDSVGDSFLYSTWQSCGSLTTAEIPDTTGWNFADFASISFLYNTWYGCSGIKDLSNIVLSNSFNTVELYTGSNNFAYTFAVTSGTPGTVESYPSFSNGSLIIDSSNANQGTPSSRRYTFQNRAGTTGTPTLHVNWR